MPALVDIEAILERRGDPSLALQALLHDLLGETSNAAQLTDLAALFRLAHDALAPSTSPTSVTSAPQLVADLRALPDRESRLTELLLAPVTVELVDELLVEAASRRSTSPASALDFALLALVAAALLPYDGSCLRHRTLARTHLALANLQRLLGHHADAEDTLARARDLLDTCSDSTLSFRYHSYAASLALDRRRIRDALQHLDRAEELARASSCPTSHARVLVQRASIESHAGRLARADELLLEAHDLLDPAEVPDLYLCVQHNRALLLLDLDAHDRALELYRSAEHLYREDRTPQSTLRHHWLLGRFAVHAKDLALATEHLGCAHRLADQLGQDFDRALLDLELGLLGLHRGEVSQAISHANRAQLVLALLDLPRETAGAQLVLASAVLNPPTSLTPEPLLCLLRSLRHTLPLPPASHRTTA